MRLYPLLGLLAPTILAQAAHAQSNLPDVTARWSAADCTTSYHDWSRDSDLIRFRDNRNRSDAERIITSGQEGFTPIEMVGSGGRAPAQWAYQLLGPDTIAITSLSTGRRFSQHRYTSAASPTLNASAPAPNRAGLRLGYSTALGVEILAQRPDWCAPTIPLYVVARDQRVFADPALTALLQRLGQSILGPSCPLALSATFQGIVGDAPNGWQRNATAAGGWAVADNPAQQATGGIDLDIAPATPTSQPTAPLAAVQTPSARPPSASIRVRPSFSLPGQALSDGIVPATPPDEASPNPAPLVPAPDPPAEQVPTARACPATYPGPENARVPMLCNCDASSLESGTVIGTGVYGYTSAMCRAARHADLIGGDGGPVLFIPLVGQTNLVASDRNGISSGAGQGAGFKPYEPTPALAEYFRRWLDLDRQAANPTSIRTADGRVLTPSMTYPPLPLDLRPAQPVAGVVLAMPGVNQMSIPVPTMPLSGEHLSPSPWSPIP